MDSTQGKQELEEHAPKLQSLDLSFGQRCIILGSYMLLMIILMTLTFSLIF